MKKTAAVILLAVIAPVLFASSLAVGCFIEDGLDIFDIPSLLETYFAYDLRDDSASLAFHSARNAAEQYNALGKALDRALSSEEADEIAKARLALESFEAGDDDSGRPCSFSYMQLTDEIRSAFESGDSIFLDDWMLANGLDILLWFSSTTRDRLVRYRIRVYDKSLHVVYDRLSDLAEIDFQSAEAVLSLLDFFYPADAGILVFDAVIPGFLSIEPEGEMAVLRAGLYSYEDLNTGRTELIEVRPRQVTHLMYTDPPSPTFSLLVTGDSNSIRLNIDGTDKGSLPLNLDGVSLPLRLNASAEGMMSFSAQLTGDTKELQINLIPAGLGDIGDYDRARKDFYRSFARTLALFGLEVAFSSFRETKPFMSAASYAGAGALAISVVDLLSDLFDYYRQSTYATGQR